MKGERIEPLIRFLMFNIKFTMHMKAFARHLKNYFDIKGISMPFIVSAAERLSHEEEMHLTVIVMTQLLNVQEDLARECVLSCVADDDDIYLLKIEKKITEYARMN